MLRIYIFLKVYLVSLGLDPPICQLTVTSFEGLTHDCGSACQLFYSRIKDGCVSAIFVFLFQRCEVRSKVCCLVH